jgi:hypothetical protein
MKIDWVVPCRFAEAHADGTMTITGAGIDSFWLPEDALRSDIGLFLAMRLVGEPSEFVHKEHRLSIRLAREGAEEQHEVAGARFRVTEPPAGGDDVEIGLLAPIFVGWRPAAFATYILEILLDDVLQKQTRLHVRRLDEQQEAPGPSSTAASTS